MVLFKWIENVGAEAVVNIRSEYGEVIFSFQGRENSIHSFSYGDIKAALEGERDFETRKNLAIYELDDFDDLDEETRLRAFNRTTRDEIRVAELKAEIRVCQVEIDKYQRVGTLLYQLSEYFKAGLITSGSDYLKLINSKPDVPSSRLTEVELATAGVFVRNERDKPGNKRSQIEICSKYLTTHAIKGKPHYTPAQLSDYASHILRK
jgi:hypothetical protein